MRLAAVDPGGTTAVAYLDVELSAGPEALEFKDPMEAVEYVRKWQPDLVAVENFVPRAGVRTWQPDALHVIGGLRYLAWTGLFRLLLQSPASAKSFSTNSKLERLGWRRPGPGGHKDDAMRHLLLAAVDLGAVDAARLL